MIEPNPQADNALSDIFQAFYQQMQTVIARQLPASPGHGGPEQQMLTPQEMVKKRRETRLRAQRIANLEEAVEERVCVKWYNHMYETPTDKIEIQALHAGIDRLIQGGFSWQDLGLDLNEFPHSHFEGVKTALTQMHQARCPRHKLQCLVQVHESIVTLLTTTQDGSSSADEILPLIIYACIETRPQSVNIINDLHFIHRFRAVDKIDGEAAYCLTNLEAAAAFIAAGHVTDIANSSPLIDLANTQESTALRSAVRHTANQGLRNITNAVDQSFKLIFGRGAGADTKRPKTLDDVRRLVAIRDEEDEDFVRSRPDGILSAFAGRRAPDVRVDGHPAYRGMIESNGNVAVESVRSLGSSLLRGFGRTASSEHTIARNANEAGLRTLPPIPRFIDLPDASSLTLAEVSVLLADYKRLAKALQILQAFEP